MSAANTTLPPLEPASAPLDAVCAALAADLLARHWRLACAESCTGGMVAMACTDLAGSSAWFDRGWVTYSNASKTELLGVAPQLLAAHGAVSEAVARAMVQGALQHAQANVALAVTGIAGPSGGSADKPVGTVWFAWAWPGGLVAECLHFQGTRADIRRAAQQHALRRLRGLLLALPFN